MVCLPKRVTLQPYVLYSNIEGEMLLVDSRNKRSLILDDIGTQILELLTEPYSLM